MRNILVAGELHYWNVLRQHIQDNDGGDKISHTQSDCTTAMAHLNVLCQHWLVSVQKLMSSSSN